MTSKINAKFWQSALPYEIQFQLIRITRSFSIQEENAGVSKDPQLKEITKEGQNSVSANHRSATLLLLERS
jgi:hypothetical protein